MNCKNCKTSFSEDTDYCPKCGGKVIRNRLTLKALFTHFSEQFLNYDNKFLKTFLHLFSKPETVIDGYIKGTRKRYVNVISYFAIALTVSGFQIFILQKFFPHSFDFSSMVVEGQIEFQQKFMNRIFEYNSLLAMLFIPVYAFMGKIVFFNINKYNYTELIVVFMYITAQTTIIGSIVSITTAIFNFSFSTISMLLFPLIILYSTYCLKRLYELNIKKIVFKTILFFFVLSIFYILFSIIAVILFVLIEYGSFQEFIEVQKKLQKG